MMNAWGFSRLLPCWYKAVASVVAKLVVKVYATMAALLLTMIPYSVSQFPFENC